MHIEACIHCDTLETMIKSVSAAEEGGASRLELCADMAADGLTPARDFVMAARKQFSRPGVLVMIRPRAGDFCYSEFELNEMRAQIIMAADCGADGVVFGLLTKQHELAEKPLRQLIEQCKKLGLHITFHRAFDATPNKSETLEKLIALGVDRILTSGTSWGDGLGAVEGIDALNALIKQANGRIEIVIGGGVSLQSAPVILSKLQQRNFVSLHAYSGIRKDGVTDVTLVKALVDAAKSE